MKRSRDLRLSLMRAGAVVALPAVLASCDSAPPTGVVLSSSSDCYQLKDPHASTQQCLAAYDQAVAAHQRSAPRFETRYQCDEQFGSCTAVTGDNGQQTWIPPMGGFLLGYALGNMTGNRAVYSTGGLPLYRDYRSGRYYRPDGGLASKRTGTVRGPAGSLSTPTRAITVSRAGFGSSAAARSTFGGGRSGAHFGG
ncbi:MAG TPA: DUF1190 domain-containing protein [Stenotrophomonas sp.]|nr:DUF1190 domain-containing protein [Stenotrophomonas sp.]